MTFGGRSHAPSVNGERVILTLLMVSCWRIERESEDIIIAVLNVGAM